MKKQVHDVSEGEMKKPVHVSYTLEGEMKKSVHDVNYILEGEMKKPVHDVQLGSRRDKEAKEDAVDAFQGEIKKPKKML